MTPVLNYLLFLLVMAGITWLMLKGMPLLDRISLRPFWRRALQVFLIGNFYLLAFLFLIVGEWSENWQALSSYQIKLVMISLAVVAASDAVEMQASTRKWGFLKTQVLSSLAAFVALSAALLGTNYALWKLEREGFYLRGGFLNLDYIEFVILLFIGFFLLTLRTLYRFQIYENQQQVLLHQMEIKELEAAKQKAQLDVLQARLNPHFLHNSLNAIASLVYDFPERAEQMALALSRMFRYTLQTEGSTLVPLLQELEAATTYLEIEKIRFEEGLTYQITVSDEVAEFPVPRLILQPLLENALKHGISQRIGQGHVRISAYLDNGRLVLTVSDNGPCFDETSPLGFGWHATQNKLQLVYGADYRLERQNLPEKQVRMELPKPLTYDSPHTAH
jgi:two-component system, LytTR family, sensor kinase